MRTKFPKAWSYLLENKSLLSGREHGKFKATGWYQLYPKNLDYWEQPKIMMPYMVTELSAFLIQITRNRINRLYGRTWVSVKFGPLRFQFAEDF